jgi:hypothetical protein
MLRSEVTGCRPRAPPQWRVILVRLRKQHWRVREQGWKETEELNGMYAFDEMRHWRDPVGRLRTLRCRRRTLFDDNPCSG